MKRTLIRTVPEAPAAAEAFSGCGHGPAPAARRGPNAPPVFVNGVEIAESAIANEAQHHGAASGPEARAAAARALAIRELLLQRARALGLSPAPEADERGRTETDEEALIRQLLEAEAPAVEPGEAECRRVYDANPDRFAAPELYEASHILFEPGDAGDWDGARARAEAVIAALADGGDFAALARAHSQCPSAGQSGSLGQMRRGDLAADFEAAALALAPGQVGALPVRTRHGWHVFRLDRIAPARPLPFAQVEPAIRAQLRARAWAAASARYVAALAGSADIEGLSLDFAGGGGGG